VRGRLGRASSEASHEPEQGEDAESVHDAHATRAPARDGSRLRAMKRDEASSTAAWVAAARSAGALLAQPLQLVQDPYGVRFASGALGQITRFGLRYPRLGRTLVARPG